MITDVEIAMSIIEIVGWAVDEDVTDPRGGLEQLKGLRMAMRGMGVHFTWHREIARWENLLDKYAAQQNVAGGFGERIRREIQGCVLEAYRSLKASGRLANGLDGRIGIVFNEARPVASDTIPYGVKAAP
jgi:hypothetical protein